MKPRGRHTDASPADAKAVWESMERPSLRRVALALTQAGKKVSSQTMYRWKSQGWRRNFDPIDDPEKAELDAAVPVLTGDPLKRLASLQADLDPPDEGARAPTDEERVAYGLRELASCAVTVLRVVKRADPAVLVAQADKIGVLLERVGNALLAAIQGLAKLHEIRAAAATDITPHGASAPDIVVPHPLAGTLEAIRRARALARTEKPN